MTAATETDTDKTAQVSDDTPMPTPGELEEVLKAQFPSDKLEVDYLDIEEPPLAAPLPSADKDTSADEEEPAETTDADDSTRKTPSEPAVDPIIAAARTLGIPGETPQEVHAHLWQQRLQAAPKPDESPKQEDKPVQPAPFEHGLNPDEFDPKLIATIEKMHAHYQQQFQTLQQSLAPVQQTVDQATAEMRQTAFEAERQAFHAVVDTLNDSERFGTGAEHNGTPQGVNRQRLFAAEQGLKQLYALARRQAPPLRELVDQAYYAEFGKELVAGAREHARAESEKQIRKQKTQRTARPTAGSNDANLTDEQRALNALSERMRAKNLMSD